MAIKNDDEQIISTIPNNEEKYISFSKKILVDKIIQPKPTENQQYHINNNTELGKKLKKKFDKEDTDVYFEIRFIDTFSFMAESLSSLVDNLHPKAQQIKELIKKFDETYDEQIDKKII